MLRNRLLSLSLFMLLAVAYLSAQQKQKFTVASFGLDAFAGTAQNEQYKKVDGSGALMAIIKVTSTSPNEDLLEYKFDFGHLNHEVVLHDDNELWVYVQRNAKLVTISRDGYTTLRNYDLGTAIQAGKTYNMELSAQARRVEYQMVQFSVKPLGVGAVVLVKSGKPGSAKLKFGDVDATGSVAKALELGNYTYEVAADDYLLADGSFTLSDRNKTHVEHVLLKPNFCDVTLKVGADAYGHQDEAAGAADKTDIYVNDELKGQGEWTGRLSAGLYTVECRRPNHRPAITNVSVVAGDPQTFTLTPPTPIMGRLMVTSNPLGAEIHINGQPHGVTPQTIDSLLIGEHHVSLTLDNYKPFGQIVNIEENETTILEQELESLAKPKKVKEPKPAKEPKPINDQPLLSSSSFYIQAGVQAGSLMAVPLSLGAYIGGVNVEATYGLGLAKSEDIYWNPSSDPDATSIQCSYKPTLYGLKLGYGIMAGRSLRLTPQVGTTIVSIKTDGSKASATSATVGLKAELALAPHVALYAAPEMGFAVTKSDVYSQLIDTSSKIKSWAGGFNCRLGLCISF